MLANNLAKSVDKTSGSDVTTEFSYDLNDRLTQKSFGDGSTIQYAFDSAGRNNSSSYSFAGQSKGISLSYGVDGRKGSNNLLSGGKITYGYDSLNREYITDVNPIAGKDPTLRRQKNYVGVSGNQTTSLIDTVFNYNRVGGVNTPLSQYHYTYDDNGNILTVTDKDGKVTNYTYDSLNQLTRVDDQKANVSTTYSYDVGGNITASATYTYTTGTLGTAAGNVAYAYGNTNWKDLLTSYNGQNITYDAIGNPLSYRNGMSFTWEGRQLKTAVANSKNLSYTYNDDGIRTGKTFDGVATTYFLDGSTILAQKTGSDILWFLYDSDGTRVGFTYNGTAYYYTTNAQGDVTGITDSNCNTVVEYTYDAWGKLLSTTGSMASTVGKINPFLYRGYYYDSETGLYYLNSRYYDPQTGRFINADDTGTLQASQTVQDSNLFTYCGNNPVMNIDPTGYFYISLSALGKILIVLGLSPVAAVIIAIGIYRLRAIIVGRLALLGLRLGAFWGPAAQIVITAIFTLSGLYVGGAIAQAILDCYAQKKKGIEFGVKRTWWGMPYAVNIYAR